MGFSYKKRLYTIIVNSIGDDRKIGSGSSERQKLRSERRIIWLIDSGRIVRLEQLRNEMLSIRAYPIRKLEGVTVGVAAFENKIKEYVEAEGRKTRDDEMKSDLGAILTAER